MDSFDAKATHATTYWWITSLAISVVCCSILFVVFAGYLFQIKEDLSAVNIRSEVTQSRLNEMSLELQVLNRRSTVQQIQIIPSPVQPQSNAAPQTISPADAAAAAAAANAAADADRPAPAPTTTTPPALPAPAKH